MASTVQASTVITAVRFLPYDSFRTAFTVQYIPCGVYKHILFTSGMVNPPPTLPPTLKASAPAVVPEASAPHPQALSHSSGHPPVSAQRAAVKCTSNIKNRGRFLAFGEKASSVAAVKCTSNIKNRGRFFLASSRKACYIAAVKCTSNVKKSRPFF